MKVKTIPYNALNNTKSSRTLVAIFSYLVSHNIEERYQYKISQELNFNYSYVSKKLTQWSSSTYTLEHWFLAKKLPEKNKTVYLINWRKLMFEFYRYITEPLRERAVMNSDLGKDPLYKVIINNEDFKQTFFKNKFIKALFKASFRAIWELKYTTTLEEVFKFVYSIIKDVSSEEDLKFVMIEKVLLDYSYFIKDKVSPQKAKKELEKYYELVLKSDDFKQVVLLSKFFRIHDPFEPIWANLSKLKFMPKILPLEYGLENLFVKPELTVKDEMDETKEK